MGDWGSTIKLSTPNPFLGGYGHAWIKSFEYFSRYENTILSSGGKPTLALQYSKLVLTMTLFDERKNILKLMSAYVMGSIKSTFDVIE